MNSHIATSINQILPKTTPHNQIVASCKSLINLLATESNRFTMIQKSIINNLISLLYQCSISKNLYYDYDISSTIIKTTVNGIINTFVIDEMYFSKNRRIGHRYYGRFGWLLEENVLPTSTYDFPIQPLQNLPKEIIRTHYTRIEEMESFNKVLLNDKSLIKFSSISELKNLIIHSKAEIFNNYYIDIPITLNEIEQIVKLIHANDKITVIIPFNINEEFGAYGIIGERIRVGIVDYNIFLPQTEPAIQDILEVILESGYPIIKSNKLYKLKNMVSNPSRAITNVEAMKRLNSNWEEMYSIIPKRNTGQVLSFKSARKYSMLTKKQTITYSNVLKQALVKNYQKMFFKKTNLSKSENNISEIYITRTGLSATTLGVYVAKDYFNKLALNPLMYVHKGFYYEAEYLIKREFKTTPNFKNTQIRIYCLNVSSNTPTSNDIFEDYSQQRNLIIRYVFKEALNNPKNNYFLVLDTTTNPLFSFVTDELTIPKNLNIFEAVSLTKYRQGDQNHFSGVVAYNGNKQLKAYIKNGLQCAHGIISARDVYFFHSLTKNTIKRTWKMYKIKSEAFKTGFNKCMSEFPQEYRWRIDSNDDSPQYIFLIPPMPIMIKTALRRNLSHEFYENNLLEDHTKSIHPLYKAFFEEFIFSILNPFQKSKTFVQANGFGLITTRITFIPGKFKYNKYYYYQDVPRISFGLKTTSSQLNILGKQLATLAINKTIQLTRC